MTKTAWRHWRPSLSTVALLGATVLFCVYSYSESQRQKTELAAAIRTSCAKEVPAVSEVCRRAAATASATPAR